MPTYDYRCKDCGFHLDLFQKMTDDPITTCPKCSQEALKRGPGGGIGLAFKGSGFYITDYTPKKEKQGCPCGKENTCSS